MIRSRITDFTKFNPFEPSVKSLSFQFLQRCSAKGTPKGKTMPKVGQKFRFKKKSEKDSTEGKSRRVQETEQFSIEFMNAPCLTWFLKPREKAREEERQRLGLVSKDRQRELDILKKKAEGKIEEEPVRLGTPGYDFVTLGLVDEEKIPKYELTVEDGIRLAKAHSRILMRQHRLRQFSENCRRKLKEAAIAALPEPLKRAALLPDNSVYPGGRVLPTLTPPIEGYHEKLRAASSRAALLGKR